MAWDSEELGGILSGAIKQQTKKGLDKDGKPFKPYSDRPFAMPYQAITRKSKADPYLIWLSELNAHNANRKTRRSQNKINSARGVKYLAKTRTGKKYIKVLWWGGHKEYKKTMYGSDKVDLHASGDMMNSFGVKKTEDIDLYAVVLNNKKIKLPIKGANIVLGWNDREQGQKAFWNIKRGRNMLGLPKKISSTIIYKYYKEQYG